MFEMITRTVIVLLLCTVFMEEASTEMKIQSVGNSDYNPYYITPGSFQVTTFTNLTVGTDVTIYLSMHVRTPFPLKSELYVAFYVDEDNKNKFGELFSRSIKIYSKGDIRTNLPQYIQDMTDDETYVQTGDHQFTDAGLYSYDMPHDVIAHRKTVICVYEILDDQQIMILKYDVILRESGDL